MMDAMLHYKVNANEISFIMHNIVYCIDMIPYVNIDFSVPSPPTNINMMIQQNIVNVSQASVLMLLTQLIMK